MQVWVSWRLTWVVAWLRILHLLTSLPVGIAAGEPQPATEEEAAPAKKRAKLNIMIYIVNASLTYRLILPVRDSLT